MVISPRNGGLPRNAEYSDQRRAIGFDQINVNAMQVGATPIVAHDYLKLHVAIKKKGFLYVYLSNEQPVQTNVYFDDFKITYSTSIVGFDSYYPFGLTFNSYQSENSVKQNLLYNGKEIQDELSLGWYDYVARQYDPVLGRFTSIDPATDLMRRHSPYNYAFDNPIRFIDYDGMNPSDTVKNGQGSQQAQVVVPIQMPPIAPSPGGNAEKSFLEQLIDGFIMGPQMRTVEKDKSESEKKPQEEVKEEPSEGGSESVDKEQNVVYRGGSATNTNFTPRPGIDDETSNPKAGLSTYRTHDQATQGKGGKSQMLDVDKLKSFGFTIVEHKDGHVSIRPPSNEMLKHWAASRPGLAGSGPVHVLTRMVEMSWVSQIVTPAKK